MKKGLIIITILSLILLLSIGFNIYFLSERKDNYAYMTECDRIIGEHQSCIYNGFTEESIIEEDLFIEESINSNTLISQSTAEDLATGLVLGMFEGVDTQTNIEKSYQEGNYWHVYIKVTFFSNGDSYTFPMLYHIKVDGIEGKINCVYTDEGICEEISL